jgi:hypothetical protein
VPVSDWISKPIASERHERDVPASPERAVQLALEIPAEGDPVVAALLRVRGMKRAGFSGSMGDFFRANRFLYLAMEPREFVVGLAQPANLFSGERLTDVTQWRQWKRRNGVKVAMSFSAEPKGDGSRLVTETQVEATDVIARNGFRVYWWVVGPFSALVRRRWLSQIAKAAAAERVKQPA